MTRRWMSVTAAAVASLALLPVSASAQELSISDPAGDAVRPGLDFTSVSVDNGDDRIVVRARFVRATYGDLIISIDPRGHRGIRLVSEYRPKGTTRNYVVPFSFEDGGAGKRPVAGRAGDVVGGEGVVDCPGFAVAWRPAKGLARLTLPSSCLRDGDYGAVRAAFLTEIDASDSDLGPQQPDGDPAASRWIPRG